MTNTKLLEEAIAASGKSKVHLAGKLGLSRQGLHLKINGNQDFRTTEVAILCQELGLTPKDRDLIFFNQDVE